MHSGVFFNSYDLQYARVTWLRFAELQAQTRNPVLRTGLLLRNGLLVVFGVPASQYARVIGLRFAELQAQTRNPVLRTILLLRNGLLVVFGVPASQYARVIRSRFASELASFAYNPFYCKS